ncbi:MAG: hypothetical protein IKU90_00695 [Clostridia bacterium]|nr:hypothetical protein [Clostridia bacterium]
MKKNLFALLKALCYTIGLHALLTVTISFLARTVHRDPGQACLFLAVTLLLVLGICLFAAIPTDKRGVLWGCFGIAYGVGLIAAGLSLLFYGGTISAAWPSKDNMAWLLFLILILSAWCIGVLAVTVVRSARIGRRARESDRQLTYARKGYRKEFPPVSKVRSVLYAVSKGLLWVIWFHTATGLLLFLLVGTGLEDTILAYVSFPVLWCLMAAMYGWLDSPCRWVFALSAGVSNLVFFSMSTYFCMLLSTDPHKYRAVLHLDSLLTEPFDNPEQLIAIGIFFSIWIAMAVFAVGHRRRKEG